MPPVGWLNDPNGLCQLDGTYHVFHQYSPDWPAPDAPRGWGHFASDDLVHWRSGGRAFAIAPDTPDEASGSYSGCAVPVPGGARLYYTGNVKEQGDHDYVRSGRRAAQILIEAATDAAAPGGLALGKKDVLLRNADYPAFCSCHVRDPKVWREDDAWWMILGARDLSDEGLVLVLRSEDGRAWENAGTVRTDEAFGFMWECPDRVALSGREWLSICPQGMQDRPWSGGLRDVAGYLPVPADGRIGAMGGLVLRNDTFRLWDHGFDFYKNLINMKINENPHLYHKEVIQHLFAALLCEIIGVLNQEIATDSSSQDQEETQADQIFRKFIELLSEDNGMHRSVSYYANALCYTPKYFSKAIKEACGRTPLKIIHEYTIEFIKDRLTRSDKSIKEIAEEFDFPNQSFFGKYVKAHLGMTPLDYRKVAKEQLPIFQSTVLYKQSE